MAWQANLLDELEADAEGLWDKLSLLCRASVFKGLLDGYWEHKKALSPGSVVRVLFCEEVLKVVRRELNRNAPARLEIEDVFGAVRDALSKEALLEAGDISMKKKRKRKKKVVKADGTADDCEVDDENGDEEEVSPAAAGPVVPKDPPPALQ